MKGVTLILTASGNELCRIPMTGVHIAVAGEWSGGSRPHLGTDMEDLLQQVHGLVAGEGMAVDVDDIGLRITLARDLLRYCESNEEVWLQVPVRDVRRSGHEGDGSGDGRFDLSLLNDLFNLDDLNEGGSDARN